MSKTDAPTAETDGKPMTPPVFSDYETWTAFANLSPLSKEGNRACVDTSGNVWLQTPTGSQSFPMTQQEALQLTQFLCDRFGLIVLNEPDAFGNGPSTCGCASVPERVKCCDCEIELWTVGPNGRAEWESERSRDANPFA